VPLALYRRIRSRGYPFHLSRFRSATSCAGASSPPAPPPPLRHAAADGSGGAAARALSCKPLLTAEEFASTEAHAARFLEALGPQLDTELREYEAAAGRASYLEDFWEDAYLEARRAPPAASPPSPPLRGGSRGGR